ncbi:MAG: tRNA lysidine(34) synthetase TilS [Gammaproteobacteria bacterium]|nr:tRNA lysidine(34) synthetase TilS [Gammaproteobacteria bacterium]
MPFNQGLLLETISALPTCKRLLIAYSGGMDSHVLLHAIWGLRSELTAEIHVVHVNHGLQSDASVWAESCSDFCVSHQIPITVVEVDATPAKGESREAAARDSRYRAICSLMEVGDILLTAHHAEDQAETVLLQLLRGSGPSGLSAMPIINGFGPGFHARPLLECMRSDLAEYAEQNQLRWLEDFSNSDTSFDRNYLRHRVIPLLKQRWPAMEKTISRSASHCAEAQQLIEEAARIDLRDMQLGQDNSMSVAALSAMPPPRARAVIRTWINDAGLRLPDTARLDRVLREMLTAREDRNPMVNWADVELRRYRDRLYLLSALQKFDPVTELNWDGETPLELPSGLGVLSVKPAKSGISRKMWEESQVTVCFRVGGERCKLLGRDNSKSLKKLFQEYGVPPWERDRIPLIKIDGQLAAVGDIWLCDGVRLEETDAVLKICWERGTGL